MKGAVLIIGSLYWDIHQNKHLNVRENWRTNHLQMNNRIHLKVPIRYGRTSGKGDNKVYTMVFSKSLEAEGNWGTAFAVPFRLDISNYAGLYDQARFLSYAEGADDTNLVKGENKWCVIGILFNPQFDTGQKQALLGQYQQQLVAERLGNEFTRFCIASELSVLSQQGEMLIQWPVTTNPKHQAALDKLDFIIATCPKQNLDAYPDAEAIKALVLRDDREYFYNNVANGITTYQDREIVEV